MIVDLWAKPGDPLQEVEACRREWECQGTFSEALGFFFLVGM